MNEIRLIHNGEIETRSDSVMSGIREKSHSSSSGIELPTGIQLPDASNISSGNIPKDIIEASDISQIDK